MLSMVKVRDIGTPGPANDTLGGVPAIYYWDLASKGRGEVLRLFCEDAEIAFKDHRWSLEDSSLTTDIYKFNPTRSLPAVELGGKIYTQSIPILRFWCTKLGKYDGKSHEDRYFVDLISDITTDWRTSCIDSLFTTTATGLVPNSNKEIFEHHKDILLPKFAIGINSHLSKFPSAQAGPFVLGPEVTYADFQIWQVYHDEQAFGAPVDDILAKSAPRLKQLVEAVEARPNVKAYFASDRYFG
jgi:glutathione S-transferase